MLGPITYGAEPQLAKCIVQSPWIQCRAQVGRWLCQPNPRRHLHHCLNIDPRHGSRRWLSVRMTRHSSRQQHSGRPETARLLSARISRTSFGNRTFATSGAHDGLPQTGNGPVKPTEGHDDGSRWSPSKSAACLLGVVTATIATMLWTRREAHAEFQLDHAPQLSETRVSAIMPERKTFRLQEVREHGANAPRQWVTKGTGVYDITDWVEAHPGGKVILAAAGSSIDPYWDIFTIHKKADVYQILEEYRIGDVDPRDLSPEGKIPLESIEDPFRADPARDPRLIVHTARPCNAETPASELSEFITDNALFYVRNHFWVPTSDPASHTITVDLGDGSDEKTYTIRDLQTKFPQHTITAVLQCSGNRRKHMSENCPRKASGLEWDVGAIGNAEWRGPLLRDVLRDAGLNLDEPPEDLGHAQFGGADAYAASIPLDKAVDPRGDVLLACEMNGQPLPRDHGFPIRVLVPGNTAARSVKWVDRITLSDEESTAQWQRRDYKCFGPNETRDTARWDAAPSIQETPVQSAITAIRQVPSETAGGGGGDGDGDGHDSMLVEGYAFSGGGRRIIRVDVSLDDGKTWDQAQLQPDRAQGSKAWSWTRWRYRCRRPQPGSVVVVKAVDDSCNVQPDTHAPTYNFRGVLANAWHRIKIDEQGQGESATKGEK